MAPEFLERVLKSLPAIKDPEGRLLCSTSGNEDAAVLRFPEGKALVQSVDVLAPVSHDPYLFGRIAAANALSDIYAMGGEPWCAMNIVHYPSSCSFSGGSTSETLQPLEGTGDDGEPDMETLAGILRGGMDALHEAGAVLAGGHTVEDKEPKYGLSVTGWVDPGHIAVNAALRPGDTLVLTKPLGTGILSTVAKAEWEGWQEAEAEFCRWAMRLNAHAAKIIRKFGLKAATDITGFGLGGHALEMALASRVCICLEADAVPLMAKVLDFADLGLIPSGSHANARHFAPHTQSRVSASLHSALFDAQTSGGLLLGVPPHLLGPVTEALAEGGDLCAVIGKAIEPKKEGLALDIV